MNVATNPVAPGAETSAKQANDNRFSKFKKLAKSLGEDTALGKDALPKLAQAVVEQAREGVIDATTKVKGPEGKMISQVEVIYNEYVAGEQTTKAIHERTTGGVQSQISKLKQLVTMGCLPNVDAVDVMDRAFAAREDMSGRKDAEGKAVKVKSAYAYYVDVARAQIKEPDTALTKEALEKLVLKAEPKEKELESELIRILKSLDRLVNGGEDGTGLMDEDKLTYDAFKLMQERVGKVAQLKKMEELRELAAKAGVKIAIG
jgi:hypothetical protein